jgi:hypothetical protein
MQYKTQYNYAAVNQTCPDTKKCYNLFKRNTETVSREYLINIAVKEIGTVQTDRVR